MLFLISLASGPRKQHFQCFSLHCQLLFCTFRFELNRRMEARCGHRNECSGNKIHCVKSRNAIDDRTSSGRPTTKTAVLWRRACVRAYDVPLPRGKAVSLPLDSNDVTSAWSPSKWYAPYGRPTIRPHARTDCLQFAPCGLDVILAIRSTPTYLPPCQRR